MAEKEVEELVGVYLRRELDGMARELGLDPNAYPSKRAIAEAIMMARKTREKVGEKVVKKMEKPLKGSVKDKINAIKQFTKAMQSKVGALQSDINKQVKVNAEAVAKIEAGIDELINETKQFSKAMQSKVANLLAAGNEQMNENKQYIKDFYG